MGDKLNQGVKTRSPHKTWLFSVTKNNWEILKEKNIWAVRFQSIIEKIRKGDRLIFYVKGSKPPCFMGAYEVINDWGPATEITWEDERRLNKIIYPWKVSIKPIQIGAAKIEELKPNLAFIRKKDGLGDLLSRNAS